jgi:hypothetical protein
MRSELLVASVLLRNEMDGSGDALKVLDRLERRIPRRLRQRPCPAQRKDPDVPVEYAFLSEFFFLPRPVFLVMPMTLQPAMYVIARMLLS